MKAASFTPILNIPEGCVGAYKIRHLLYPAGHRFETATARTAIMGGQHWAQIAFNKPVRFHELSYQHGVWMTDLPVEQAQSNPIFHNYTGHVLVGGLGIGYAATRIAERKQVRSVTVVEISAEVIKLAAPHLPTRVKHKITVVKADLFKFLKQCASAGRRFDRAFYDIWQSDSEDTFFHVVVPLLAASQGIVARRPDCWNEDVMRGQLFFSLRGKVVLLNQPSLLSGKEDETTESMLDKLCSRANSIWHDWQVPFFCWYRARRPDAETAQAYLTQYARTYGLPGHAEAWANP